MRPRDAQAPSEPSSGARAHAVKTGEHPVGWTGRRSHGRELRRHLEGWPLVPISVGMALIAIALVVPRPIEPDAIPLPRIDRAEQRAAALDDARRADEAEHQRLPFDVRSVGEVLRRYGAATSASQDQSASLELEGLRQTARRALASVGPEPLLRLRAVQTRLFVAAVHAWSHTGVENDDLKQLGGGFIAHAIQSGWVTPDRRLFATADEQALLFRLRWTALVGFADTMPFRPSLNDWRAYYRFLIEHPEFSANSDSDRVTRRRLQYVEALTRHDSQYLADLARGALYVRLGDYPAAVNALRTHLADHPDGPWALRARNYLAVALERASSHIED